MYDKDRTTILDRREMLRVKFKSLRDENKVIRSEEARTYGALACELRAHRISIVRVEARATYLAYGIIRGRPVERIERKGSERTEALWEKVRAMIRKYGPVNAELRATLLESCKN